MIRRRFGRGQMDQEAQMRFIRNMTICLTMMMMMMRKMRKRKRNGKTTKVTTPDNAQKAMTTFCCYRLTKSQSRRWSERQRRHRIRAQEAQGLASRDLQAMIANSLHRLGCFRAEVVSTPLLHHVRRPEARHPPPRLSETLQSFLHTPQSHGTLRIMDPLSTRLPLHDLPPRPLTNPLIRIPCSRWPLVRHQLLLFRPPSRTGSKRSSPLIRTREATTTYQISTATSRHLRLTATRLHPLHPACRGRKAAIRSKRKTGLSQRISGSIFPVLRCLCGTHGYPHQQKSLRMFRHTRRCSRRPTSRQVELMKPCAAQALAAFPLRRFQGLL